MEGFKSKAGLAEAIKNQITTKDSQAVKAMLRIYEYQTADEQDCGGVINNNGIGFARTDSELLTSFCRQYEKCGSLSAKQLELLKKKIGKYAGQLVHHAIANGIYVKVGKTWVVNTQKCS